MRLLYVVIGAFIGSIVVSLAAQSEFDFYSAAHNRHLVKAQVMAYYQGHSKGMADSEMRLYDNYGSCFEELDTLRKIIKQEKKK